MEDKSADARRERFAKVAALTRSVDQGCEMVTRLSLKLNEAKAALAKVTAERDDARRMAATRLHAIESMRRAALRILNVSTEGETE